MAESFLEKLRATERPAEPIGPAVEINLADVTDRDRKYALAALKGEVDNILAVPIGEGRNSQLNISGVKCYGYAAAGLIDEDLVTETLGQADGGLVYPATRKTLASARDAAFNKYAPKVIPASTREEVPPWETPASQSPSAPPSGDPLSEHYQPSQTEPTGSDTSSTTPPNSSTTPPTTNGSTETASTTSTSTTTASDAEARHKALVAVEAARLRLNRDAKRLVDQEDAGRLFRVPPYLNTLADELDVPDEPVSYRVANLIPTGANVLLTAQFKAGKTSLVNNLARSLVDGEPFLGRHAVEPFDGKVALFNYEVDARQYRRWLRDIGVTNVDRITVLNLRGYRLPLTVPHVEDWTVEYLKRNDVRVWIVDPFARAFTGGDENSNAEAGAWLDTVDVIKERAGVSELILPNHTGRGEHEAGEEHGRGATRLDDWADVRWILTKDKGGARFFRASGRDVETDEVALGFDDRTRRLSVTGGDRYEVERDRVRTAVLQCVTDRPGLGTRELREAVRPRVGVDKFNAAVEALMTSHAIHKSRVGHTVGHFVGAGSDVQNGDPLEGV